MGEGNIMAGINLNSFKKKTNSKSEKGKDRKKRIFDDVNPNDLIKTLESTVDSVINLGITINESKTKAKCEQEDTKRSFIESNERIEELKAKISFDAAKMKVEFEKFKLENMKEMKKIETDFQVQMKELDIQDLQNKRNHETNMRMIDSYQKALDTVLELYKIYYERKIKGEYVGVDNSDNITSDLSRCIEGLNVSIKALNSVGYMVES